MPLIYENIELHSAASLQTFASFLLENHHTDYGAFVRSLTLLVRSPSHDHITNVLTLLAHMPHLQKYSTVMQASVNELAHLSRLCRESLQICHLPIVDEGRTTISMMERLGSFTALQTLEIHAIWPSYADDADYSTINFTFPAITHLILRTNRPSSCINFILCTHIPCLTNLELQLHVLENTFFSLLSSFFRRHPHIKSLTITAVEDWLEEILLLPMSPSSVVFSGGIPPVGALERLSPSVQKIVFHEREWSGRVWEFFQTLLILPRTDLREIGVCLPRRFQWKQFAPESEDTIADDHALFFGKILWYAKKLRGRGLEVFDEVGDNMDAAFSNS